MHISIEREHLRAALALAVTVTDKRSTVPAYACVLLTAKPDGFVTIAASDLSLSYTSQVACTVKEPGVLALDARGLFDIVTALAADEMTIRSVDGKAEVRAGKSRFQVGAQPSADFPTMPNVSALKFSPVDGAAFSRMADAVAFCVDPKDTNPATSGVFYDFSAGRAMAVSTSRCGLMEIATCKAEGRALIPRPALATIEKVAEGPIEVAVTASEIFVRKGATVVGAKLIEGTFAIGDDLRGVFFRPSSDHEMNVGRIALMDALKRVSLVSSKAHGHEVRMAIKPGLASLASHGAGISEDEIAIGYDGKGHECAFAANLVIEALEAMSGDEITVGFNDSKTLPSGGVSWEPIIFRPLAEELGNEHAVVVMTIRH